jgi:hypothetical protein
MPTENAARLRQRIRNTFSSIPPVMLSGVTRYLIILGGEESSAGPVFEAIEAQRRSL